MISRVRCPERRSSFRIASYWRMTYCVKDVHVFAKGNESIIAQPSNWTEFWQGFIRLGYCGYCDETLGLQLYVLCCANKEDIASLEMPWIRYCSTLHLQLRARLTSISLASS